MIFLYIKTLVWLSHTSVAFIFVQYALRPKKHLSIDCVLHGVGPEAKEKVEKGAYR